MISNLRARSALISACEKGKRPGQALQVFAAMEQQVMVPDAIMYNALVSSFEKGRQAKCAL